MSIYKLSQLCKMKMTLFSKVIQALWRSTRTMTALTKTNKMFRPSVSQVDDDTEFVTSNLSGNMNHSRFEETRFGNRGCSQDKSHSKFKLKLVKITRALETRSKL